jgi:hypothetical protein
MFLGSLFAAQVCWPMEWRMAQYVVAICAFVFNCWPDNHPFCPRNETLHIVQLTLGESMPLFLVAGNNMHVEQRGRWQRLPSSLSGHTCTLKPTGSSLCSLQQLAINWTVSGAAGVFYFSSVFDWLVSVLPRALPDASAFLDSPAVQNLSLYFLLVRSCLLAIRPSLLSGLICVGGKKVCGRGTGRLYLTAAAVKG